MSKCYASAVIAVAEGEIGYKEKASNVNLDSKTANAGSNNYTKYARDFDEKYTKWYNGKKNGYAWCDMFVDWCFLTAFGYEKALELLCQPEKSAGAGCTYSYQYYKKKNQVGTTPKVGAQIFFGTTASNLTHTGLVYKYDSSKVYTIEGNTSDQVAKREYAIGSSKIYGYGYPAYDTEEATTASKLTRTATEGADAKTIWTYLMGKIGNAYGVAGLMGNLYAESALRPTNLQNSYEKKLGYGDSTYTAAVDDGSYTNFVKDSAGYGLAQWTYHSRKQALLTYAQGIKSSIGNLTTQLEFLYKELSENYSSVLSSLKKAENVRAASDLVLTKFEAPADQSTSVQEKRAAYGQEYYNSYAGSTTSATTKTTTTGATSGGSTQIATIKKLQGAEKKESGYSSGKKYKTTTALNLRYGASAEKLSNGKDKYGVIAVLAKGTTVTYYGYYTINADGTKWLYVAVDGKTGFVSSKYLTA